MPRSAVIAVGGNSLIRAGERGTIEEQQANATRTARSITQLISDGWRVVVTHGNGPQVGAALLRSERAAGEVYHHPLDVCVATTQGEIGYLLERGLESELHKANIHIPVLTLLTQVRVDHNDPAFQSPTKPVGPFYSKAEADAKRNSHGWAMVEDAGRGYRRVVPSPEPLEVLNTSVIRQLLELGAIVIALGGGGIPVVWTGNSVVGVEAVIDKDRASSLLASVLKVDSLIISTEVDHVYLNYRTPQQLALRRVTVREMKRYCEEKHFPSGSMGPKVEAAIRFLESGGKEVIITSLSRLAEAVNGNEGTHILP